MAELHKRRASDLEELARLDGMSHAAQEARTQLQRQVDDLSEKLRGREDELHETRSEMQEMRARGEALLDKVSCV